MLIKPLRDAGEGLTERGHVPEMQFELFGTETVLSPLPRASAVPAEALTAALMCSLTAASSGPGALLSFEESAMAASKHRS